MVAEWLFPSRWQMPNLTAGTQKRSTIKASSAIGYGTFSAG
jgi:hypothetical protein